MDSLNQTRWSVDVPTYILGIFNLQATNSNKFQKCINKNFNQDKHLFDHSKFITVDELKNDGFIKDDKIMVAVYIKISKFEKIK